MEEDEQEIVVPQITTIAGLSASQRLSLGLPITDMLDDNAAYIPLVEFDDGLPKPNLIALMTETQFNEDIPEKLKETAWQRAADAAGNIVYSKRKWKEMTEDVNYKGWYGDTLLVRGVSLRGKPIGDRYVVKGKMDLATDNVLALLDTSIDTIIHYDDLEDFFNENNIK